MGCILLLQMMILIDIICMCLLLLLAIIMREELYHITQRCPKKMKKAVTVNLGPHYDAVIINKQAPPPPEIPMKTL